MSLKKLFTLDEANSLVPKLLGWVPEIQKLSASMNRDFPDIRNAREKAKWNGGSVEGVEYLNVVMKYNHWSGRLNRPVVRSRGFMRA